MSSIVQGLQKRSFINLQSASSSPLPVSQFGDQHSEGAQGLRKRLSSLSLKIQPITLRSSSSAAWAYQRSKSAGAYAGGMGHSLRKWWDWGWAWILSRKPSFAMDLEMNQDETKALGSHNKGSWRHVLYKVRSEVRKVVACRSDKVGLPQTYRYDSSSYSKNFDDTAPHY